MCKDGFHGPDCTQKCGSCKPATICNHTTGLCKDGCHKNWNGSKCNGTYLSYAAGNQGFFNLKRNNKMYKHLR